MATPSWYEFDDESPTLLMARPHFAEIDTEDAQFEVARAAMTTGRFARMGEAMAWVQDPALRLIYDADLDTTVIGHGLEALPVPV